MYTIVQIGSEQFKVAEGDVISAKRINEEEGHIIDLDKVLMYVNDKDIRVGQPFLKDVKVRAKVTKHLLDKKVIAFKFKKRKSSAKKTKGHRQQLTELNITQISV